MSKKKIQNNWLYVDVDFDIFVSHLRAHILLAHWLAIESDRYS